MKKIVFIVVATVAGGVFFLLAAAGKQNRPAPASEFKLPPALAKFMKERLPEWRLPSAADFSGRWEGLRTSPAVPFASAGDFDGDGQEDLALILLDAQSWKVAVFLKSGSEYRQIELKGFPGGRSFFQDHRPQDFRLLTVKKAKDAAGCSFDALVFASLEDPDNLIRYCWNPKYNFFSVSRQNDMTD